MPDASPGPLCDRIIAIGRGASMRLTCPRVGCGATAFVERRAAEQGRPVYAAECSMCDWKQRVVDPQTDSSGAAPPKSRSAPSMPRTPDPDPGRTTPTPSTCAVVNCDRDKIIARGLCTSCYSRWHKANKPDLATFVAQPKPVNAKRTAKGPGGQVTDRSEVGEGAEVGEKPTRSAAELPAEAPIELPGEPMAIVSPARCSARIRFIDIEVTGQASAVQAVIDQVMAVMGGPVAEEQEEQEELEEGH